MAFKSIHGHARIKFNNQSEYNKHFRFISQMHDCQLMIKEGSYTNDPAYACNQILGHVTQRKPIPQGTKH